MPIPTQTTNTKIPYRFEGFETLTAGLDYAARGETGLNFYSGRGELARSLSYCELRERSMEMARRLARADLPRGARVAIVAETNADFFCFFFACQYAGLIPVPLPLPLNLGGKEAYIERLHLMVKSAGAALATASPELVGYLREAVRDLPVRMVGTWDEFRDLPADGGDPRPLEKDENCYIQYSSGSTRFPHGVTISQRSATSNAHAIITQGLRIKPGDRCTSWLPLYHDMGLIGFFTTPLLSQVTVDYIATSDFARRPLLWLKILSLNGSSLSFSPTFGYDLCLHRVANGVASSFDLSSWRVAGIGGEMIRPDILKRFAETFAPSGFRETAFVASYGLAESTLAVSFAQLDKGIEIDRVDKRQYALSHRAVPPKGNGATPPEKTRSFVICGRPMAGHAVAICDKSGAFLADRQVGKVLIKGPSLMAGYFGDPAATARVMRGDGWLDTGDIGYMIDGSVVVTGRSKDLIICNGRNIWPHDIEWAIERLPGVRRGDVAAISVSAPDDSEAVVIIVQCRLTETEARHRFRRDIVATVHTAVGVDCEVVLVPPRSLPFTSSGKLSRAATKQNYLAGAYTGLADKPRPPVREQMPLLASAGD